jgi:hypothetical protein
VSLSLVETGVPGDKPLQAKLRADYFSHDLCGANSVLTFLIVMNKFGGVKKTGWTV